ncbi:MULTISPECIES: MATE family efflux transporter [unclassified Sphingomonas]|uniref:MATE family efflux transporter n=1 Tax=unclassified Sphingomonas TaxID=196159 RepID=UPI0006FAD602|nr:MULTISPECIES: MATE family efflux transporter [unclassified Sphingomonas]KQX19597.1 MATE family efflux transporter [Sphingomonas sp. Root1294]KQY65798.1 MATE family efflux transporter [Sphingomonas sp. Root50]KRB94896.1 MATE family efflux transporter [Sphingomonas sp. Root720]
MAGGPQNLTEGPIGRTLLLFAIPTLAANVLQSLNASINMIWVGRFLGEQALAATANAGNILFMIFSALFGCSMAAMILVGQHVGRKDIDGARRVVGAAAALLLGISFVMMAIGIGLTDKLLHLLGTPRDAAPLASAYLKMMFWGLPFSAIMVLMMMTLRGIGDAMTPLWFMIVGIVLDAGLNPFLIAGIGPFPEMGIVGSAVATLIANAVAMLGMLAVVYWRDLPIRLRGRELAYLVPGPALIRLIFGKGVMMGLQMFVLTAAALVMVGLVNQAGVIVTAAYGVAFQLWNYIQMPSMAVASAVSAMAAQNIGAGRWDRLGSITRIGLFYNFLMTGVLILLLSLLDRHVLGLFLGAASPAIAVAARIHLLASWSFLFSGATMVLFGTIRANGVVLMPLIIMIIGLFGSRLGFAIFARPWLHVDALWWAFPVGSIVSATLTWAYFRRGGWKKASLVDQAERAEHAAA